MSTIIKEGTPQCVNNNYRINRKKQYNRIRCNIRNSITKYVVILETNRIHCNFRKPYNRICCNIRNSITEYVVILETV